VQLDQAGTWAEEALSCTCQRAQQVNYQQMLHQLWNVLSAHRSNTALSQMTSKQILKGQTLEESFHLSSKICKSPIPSCMMMITGKSEFFCCSETRCCLHFDSFNDCAVFRIAAHLSTHCWQQQHARTATPSQNSICAIIRLVITRNMSAKQHLLIRVCRYFLDSDVLDADLFELCSARSRSRCC